MTRERLKEIRRLNPDHMKGGWWMKGFFAVWFFFDRRGL